MVRSDPICVDCRTIAYERALLQKIANLRAEVEKLRELIALEDANAEAGGWGAAVGARLERIKGLRAALSKGGE